MARTYSDIRRMISYQLTSTVIGVTVALCILYLVRRDHLHGPYAIWWLSIAGLNVLLGLFPRVFDWIALRVGVNYPPILAIVLAISLLLIKLLTIDLEHSRQERNIRRLAQRLAILEAHAAADASPTADNGEKPD